MKARKTLKKQTKEAFSLAQESVRKKDRIVNAIVFAVVLSVAILTITQII